MSALASFITRTAYANSSGPCHSRAKASLKQSFTFFSNAYRPGSTVLRQSATASPALTHRQHAALLVSTAPTRACVLRRPPGGMGKCVAEAHLGAARAAVRWHWGGASGAAAVRLLAAGPLLAAGAPSF